MRRTLIIATLVALALAACGGDDGDTLNDAIDDLGQPAVDAPACSDLAGMLTPEVLAAQGCMENGSLSVTSYFTGSCPDGRTLHWNDYGWGYSDGAWQAHARPDGQLVPPDADLAACPA